ncbi:hypothetical protein GPECTOR_8g11 [Gonium pectorale]|uniref:Uncharacterized protein n=1 Tax=Gonium pectorale TaxID=33097 RepID=A0A150GS90_GONPE|nr:hypothetical protein GPECTOR_8g11 [Gonium pectorale]|eukprot:KXZ52715.1 hypothetical protein GPECTOR_8g11 [Gonium pectorale]
MLALGLALTSRGTYERFRSVVLLATVLAPALASLAATAWVPSGLLALGSAAYLGPSARRRLGTVAYYAWKNMVALRLPSRVQLLAGPLTWLLVMAAYNAVGRRLQEPESDDAAPTAEATAATATASGPVQLPEAVLLFAGIAALPYAVRVLWDRHTLGRQRGRTAGGGVSKVPVSGRRTSRIGAGSADAGMAAADPQQQLPPGAPSPLLYKSPRSTTVVCAKMALPPGFSYDVAASRIQEAAVAAALRFRLGPGAAAADADAAAADDADDVRIAGGSRGDQASASASSAAAAPAGPLLHSGPTAPQRRAACAATRPLKVLSVACVPGCVQLLMVLQTSPEVARGAGGHGGDGEEEDSEGAEFSLRRWQQASRRGCVWAVELHVPPLLPPVEASAAVAWDSGAALDVVTESLKRSLLTLLEAADAASTNGIVHAEAQGLAAAFRLCGPLPDAAVWPPVLPMPPPPPSSAPSPQTESGPATEAPAATAAGVASEAVVPLLLLVPSYALRGLRGVRCVVVAAAGAAAGAPSSESSGQQPQPEASVLLDEEVGMGPAATSAAVEADASSPQPNDDDGGRPLEALQASLTVAAIR